MNTERCKVAVLYQAQQPPIKDGITKPMKPGGYADSGADIGYALQQHGVAVITPVERPEVEKDFDWVFPDTVVGIERALGLGADTLWLNTVLFEGHPVDSFKRAGLMNVGQMAKNVDVYDDKVFTNRKLTIAGLAVPQSEIVEAATVTNYKTALPFPLVAKPIRGRGSIGVSLVTNPQELSETLRVMFAEDLYGTSLYLERFLPGEEITVTVMPPGGYTIKGQERKFEGYWSLPGVRRFNHDRGIAPYNGTVAVVNNSAVLTDDQEKQDVIQSLYRQCEIAANLVGARAPIRIDCRADEEGHYFLFDLNMKPNMTGASRPHRQDQDSLTALAARKLGWSFPDLLLNMLRQAWTR